jgi:hypothetical protein
MISNKYFKLKYMDEYTYNNWVRIKNLFETSGNTDNFFYKRACSIVIGELDPIDKIMKTDNYGTSNEGNQTK